MDNGSDSEALIACALHDPNILVETKVIPEMMAGKCGLIFGVMKEMLLSGVRPDFETLYIDKRTYEAKDVLLTANERAFTSANWQHFESNIIESWKVKKLANLGMVLADQKGKSGELVNVIEKTLLDLGRVMSGNDIVGIETLFPAYLQNIIDRKAMSGKIPGVSWGFDQIDIATLGARNGQFVVIGARPSEGKSAIGVQMLRQQGMTMDVPVGLITIESSAAEVVSRFVAGGVPVDSMKTSLGFYTSTEFAKIGLFVRNSAEKAGMVFIYDRPGITLTEVRSACRRMVLNHSVKVIYIDYLQLIRVPGKKDKVAEILEVSNSLKEIARELNICVVALAQLRRDDKKERPTMGSIQWSSQIEQDADQIWLLWHKREKETGQIKESFVILEKVRDGVTCDIPVVFEKQFVSFREVKK